MHFVSGLTPSWAHPKAIARMVKALDKFDVYDWTSDEKQVRKEFG